MNEFYVFLIFKILIFLVEKKMPDESCRACGGTLAEFSQCAGCKKTISLICRSCHTKTAEQFHSYCVLGQDRLDDFRNPSFPNVQNITLA